MKKRNTILLFGILSIIMLVTVQIIIISGVWWQKDEMFNLRYRLQSQDALSVMNRRWGTDGFDTARMVIRAQSAEWVNEITKITDDSLIAAKKSDMLLFVTTALNTEEDLSQWLSLWFERNGVDSKFKHNIRVNRFELLKADTVFPVYVSEEFSSRVNRRPSPQATSRRRPERTSVSEIYVKGERYEENNFRLDFDFFIDFSDKQNIILRETSASLVLSLLSILVVVGLFMITYKNLMEEKRLSNLKTDFINNMTHELKTPLSTITVAGRTLEMPQIRSNDEKILETAKMIGKQSVHLNQLINMILEISMWERTQFQLDKKQVKFEELMNEIVGSFKTGCGNCASLDEKYNFNGAEVDLDTVYFTTLMNNLLSNAVKYSEKDPVIEIEGFTEDNKIFVRVADNGIGISKNDQKHVFDKFYRASTGNIHKYKGLGLGLYYVKKIAEAHGGDVTVSSKPGKGSIFTVTIPY
ncbi:MAG: HAMP domain-containing sensor histidine kinase [Bacteroidales bacterium]